MQYEPLDYYDAPNDYPGYSLTTQDQARLLSNAFAELKFKKIAEYADTIRHDAELRMYARCAELIASLRKQTATIELLQFAELI